VGYENRDLWVQGGWPGNIEPRSDRSARRGEGKPGYLETSDPEAVELGEIFLREQMKGFQDLLRVRQNPVSLFMLFGCSFISIGSIIIRSV
jgi:hypothetical protein